MYGDDFAQFQALLESLAVVYGKEVNDQLVQTYWNSLRDLTLPRVKQLAEQHLRRGKFFPKPVELRPKEDPPPTTRTPSMDAAFREAEDRAIRNLEELRQHNPAEWELIVAGAKGYDCNAIRLHKQYGSQLWYDLEQRCWRV